MHPITHLSDFTTVIVTSQQFPTIINMARGQLYTFRSDVACFIKQGTNPTASAAAGSMYVAAGQSVCLSGADGAKLAVIRDAADGKATLTPTRD